MDDKPAGKNFSIKYILPAYLNHIQMLHENWNLRTIQGREGDKYVSRGLFLSPALTSPDLPKLCCLALWEAPGKPDLTTLGWPFISVLRWQKEQSAVSLGQLQLQTQLTPLLSGPPLQGRPWWELGASNLPGLTLW